MTSLPQASSKKQNSWIQRALAWADAKKADLVLGAIFLLVTVLYARFMFNDRVSTIGLIALAALWLAHWALAGWRVTPLDAPILGLLILLPVTLAITVDLSLTTPKVHGILLGLSLYYIVTNALRTRKIQHLAVFGLVVLALGVSVLGLVGTQWTNEKILDLSAVYQTLPQWIDSIPRYVDQGGIHRNLIGGALTFFLPFLASLLWDVWRVDFSAIYQDDGRARLAKIGMITLLILSVLLAAFVLILTQSRGGYLGAFVGLLTLAVIKDRRYLWALPLLAIILLTVVQRTAQGDLDTFLTLIDTTRGGTLPGRIEIWRRATLLVQDFPFTGTGIGTFNPLTNALYPYFRFGDPQVPHAHNMILTMAVDLGIPGLILYTTLLGGFFVMIWKTAKGAGRWTRATLIGLGTGLLAHQVFGIMDAYMLGTKLGAILWIYFGVAAAAFRFDNNMEATGLPAPNRDIQAYLPWLGDLGKSLLAWLLIAMLAIAALYMDVILGLALAVIGGIALGIGLVTNLKGEDPIVSD